MTAAISRQHSMVAGHPAPCPNCRHWLRRCAHPEPLKRAEGGEPGDERTVQAWWSLAGMEGRSGIAPALVDTRALCPGFWRVKR